MRVLICGDLAFFAAVLGKVNMSGKWCVWCQLGPSEWSVPNHDTGEGWTIKKMHELRENIIACQVITPADKKGIVEAPLIDAVPVDHIIFSLLHAQIGVGNKLLSSFLEWVDYRVENLPQEVIDARDAHILAVVDQEKAVQNRDEWLGQNEAFYSWVKNGKKGYK